MRFIRDNGLTIVLLGAFLVTIIAMFFAGWNVQNQELAEHGRAPIDLFAYLVSGEFIAGVMENWESEFLQMAFYVMLTAILIQRGSAESKDPDQPSPEDEDPKKKARNKSAPWPVRAGGLWRELYSYSLGIALALLFLLSFVLHWVNSWRAANEEAEMHGEPPGDLLSHLLDAQLWYESMQNWQSEFLSTAVLVVLSIFLRFKGSPESKPVAAPHSKTGH